MWGSLLLAFGFVFRPGHSNWDVTALQVLAGLPPKAGCESRPTVGQRWAACGARRECATYPT